MVGRPDGARFKANAIAAVAVRSYTVRMNARSKILVAMSGGVDSSVAACLLKEQGCDVVGVFMRLGVAEAVEQPMGVNMEGGEGRSVGLQVRASNAATAKHQGCCSAADANDARLVAGRMGIPFYALNFEKDFSDLIDYFADEYAAARTPNPCVMCNQWLKFGRLQEYAGVVGADLIATGHYARVDEEDGCPRLRRAVDRAKDQSYVLFGVPADVLGRVRFPLGELTKAEVRRHARRFGLALHDKPESQDICFVPDRAYARVVRARRPDAFRTGRIRHIDGRILGEHAGLPNFTIGQRRGLNVAVGDPVYVRSLDAATDTIVVGPRESLLRDSAEASRVNWLIETPVEPFRAGLQIRYNHAGVEGVVHPLPGGRVRVEFDESVAAVTPGQALVMYRGEMVVGGGWIDG